MSCMGTWYLKGILMPSVSIDSTTALVRLWNRNTYNKHAACQGASCHMQAKSIHKLLSTHHPKICRQRCKCLPRDQLRCLLRLC